jgi:ATP-dependent DNA ligase
MFKAICDLGLEGVVSDAPYKSGPSKAWLKIKNPNAPAATRVIDVHSEIGTSWSVPRLDH